jgi:Cu(I)/Ag(I) efflux system membrane fusion protein
MKHSIVMGAVIVVTAALAVGWWAGRATAPEASAPPMSSRGESPPKVLYYRNPMGLPDTSPVPKKDAMGMDYLPVYDGQEPASAKGSVVLPPEKVQKLGVRTEAVRLETLPTSVRASAAVQVDETRQYAIAPKFEGWVETLYANQSGMRVARGHPLLAVYSPELVAAQSEYRIADAAARGLEVGDPTSAASMRRLRDASRARLRNWDIGEAQLARIGTSTSGDRLILTSPADAVVIEKLIVQGDRFEAGQTILRLADLSTVWVVASVPASAAGSVSPGDAATFVSTSLPGRTFEGKVTFVQPVVDQQARTLGVRVELPNPEGVLRPGLFGDVTLTRPTGPAVLTVSAAAVLDSGLRQTVLVQVSEGRFAPRDVVVGERTADRIELREGVQEGEIVVVSANFLIDAESNLQSALDGMAPPAHAAHGASVVAPAPEPTTTPEATPHQHEPEN